MEINNAAPSASLDIHKSTTYTRINIPNGCLDAYEVKVNIGIFKYQEKVKLISKFQRFFSFFNGLLEFAPLSLKIVKIL